MIMLNQSDTIAAIATPIGKGGIGIIRISGPLCTYIAEKTLGAIPEPRYATAGNFYNEKKEILDFGVAIYFAAPHSFTGEDVLELQGHGGPVILDLVLKTVLSFGARLAKPGEFSERAFLNNRIDLTQAEAIADLINANSEQAARSAVKSLQGEFSNRINQFKETLTHLRKMIEAAIDFSDEEIDFLNQQTIAEQLNQLLREIRFVYQSAQQGALLQEGINVVIAGEPNVGKSSLLNALSGKDSAIVTDIAGTTRDVLKEQIQIAGIPLHIIDTAGLRETTDVVEQEGVRRAKKQIAQADLILLVIDANENDLSGKINYLIHHNGLINLPIIIVKNKIDLTAEQSRVEDFSDFKLIKISAKRHLGLNLLSDEILKLIGYQSNNEGIFSARRRHLVALKKAEEFLLNGLNLLNAHGSVELLAEDLRLAQVHLSEITGEFSSDDLLGEIFSSFCIGK